MDGAAFRVSQSLPHFAASFLTAREVSVQTAFVPAVGNPESNCSFRRQNSQRAFEEVWLDRSREDHEAKLGVNVPGNAQ
jgi:hypothetical protein